jgi:ribonuclease E
MATKRMLIDSTHPEETRVAVIEGDRLTEYDVEIASRRQLKGNIYLAKVTRVEPSLQAAFVEYGGNRHGFLAFNEIHPDYYQIPVADREALLAEQAEADRRADARRLAEDLDLTEDATADQSVGPGENGEGENGDVDEDEDAEGTADENGGQSGSGNDDEGGENVEIVGGVDEDLDVQRPRPSPRHYKIQEVIKRRQILLVQVVKEERGTKGAALTTYLSIAGRYCVLMPNTTRGGGISRKITSTTDRKRLKKILGELGLPEGMAVIVRTAGSERSKAEIRRDYEYLIRLWNNIRDLVLTSMAPTLVYEEGNLIKRSLRDLYDRDTDEILIEGESAYRTAKDFMKLFIPSHAKKVQLYEGGNIPLFHRYQVENELEAMHLPRVELKSGGSIVLNPTEALVAVDVNSGRSTRERHIEETALRTNLEACDEIARQLRLRDLAGLIVIDFIDMENTRNQGQVERRLKEAMKSDRARVQLGRISTFGLLELSRQRLRPSLFETSFTMCSFCTGTGVRRTTESTALSIFRRIEQEGVNGTAGQITVKVPAAVAFYLLNNKRWALLDMEKRYGMTIVIVGDDALIPPDFEIYPIGERAPYVPEKKAVTTRGAVGTPTEPEDDADMDIGADAKADLEEDAAPDAEEDGAVAVEADEHEEAAKRTRRRRPRRRKRAEPEGMPATGPDSDEAAGAAAEAIPEAEVAFEAGAKAAPADPREDDEDEEGEDEEGEELQAGDDEQQDDEQAQLAKKRRRRGKRGGRRRGRRPIDEPSDAEAGAHADAMPEFPGLPGAGTPFPTESSQLADMAGEPLTNDEPGESPGGLMTGDGPSFDAEDDDRGEAAETADEAPAELSQEREWGQEGSDHAMPEAHPEEAPAGQTPTQETLTEETLAEETLAEETLADQAAGEPEPLSPATAMDEHERPTFEKQEPEGQEPERAVVERQPEAVDAHVDGHVDGEVPEPPESEPPAAEMTELDRQQPDKELAFTDGDGEQQTADERRDGEEARAASASRTVVINVGDDDAEEGEGGRRGWWQRLINS